MHVLGLKHADDDEPVAGLRERGKQERLRRVKSAAIEAFRTQGYEQAGMREIARLANVSIGTLFLYAKDKRDLLFLVVNEDLDLVSQTAISAVPGSGTVTERVVALLAPIYHYFGAQPEIARTILREAAHVDQYAQSSGAHAQRFSTRMQRWIAAIIEIIEGAGRHGAIMIGDDAPVLGRALFSLHMAEVRNWLAKDTPVAEAGLADLARVFGVILANREKSPAP